MDAVRRADVSSKLDGWMPAMSYRCPLASTLTVPELDLQEKLRVGTEY